MEVEPKLFHKERLDNLVVEQDALRYPVWLEFTTGLVEGGWVNNGELLREGLKHVAVFYLESAHYVFAAENQIHDACHNHPLSELL